MSKAGNLINRYLCDGAQPVVASPTSTAAAASAFTAAAKHAAPAAATVFFKILEEATAACAADWAGWGSANVGDKLNGAAANAGQDTCKAVAGQAAAGGKYRNRLADKTSQAFK